jgi:hypothetical protein
MNKFEDMDIGIYISDLLFEHDCVVIPGFGGFIGNYAPARVNSFNHTFFPPSKSLLFNINLRQNDGLLATRIVHEENIAYEEAMARIRNFVDHCNSVLLSGKKISIERVGVLLNDAEGNTQFFQDEEINYLEESYGLSSFVSLPVRRESAQRQMERKITRYVVSPASRKRVLPKALKWAALLALPIGTAAILGITNFDKIRSFSINYSGMLFPSGPTVSAPPAGEKVTMTIPASGRVSPVEKTEAPAPDVQLKPKAEIPIVTDRNGPFSIVVGAFKIRENADRFVSKLKTAGHNAFIVDQTKTGLYRVSIDSFSSRDEALEAMTNIRATEFPSAWLLEK